MQSPLSNPYASLIIRVVETADRWDLTMYLGFPVDPEEFRIIKWSVGLQGTQGSISISGLMNSSKLNQDIGTSATVFDLWTYKI